ncbi:MAG TPA: SDR family NAD(P)-dependent oxidoreductase [Baekduia sp.]|nr:SDR family NAD(P)-dependent oxidoreductase [Baekduia sp.]
MSALEGRRIAVAGAGGTLGPAVVHALAAQGAWVAAADRREDALAGLPAGDARAADLSSDAGARAWAEAIGDVDGVLHLVGGWKGGQTVEDLDLADLELLEALLFRTVVHTTRAFAPKLKAAGERGRFALVSSSVVGAPTAGNAAYAATKAAAEAWTLALAAELAESGATANVVVVQALTTEPHRSFTHVDDVAAALAFLCSDAAARMNGQRLHLHG